MSSDTAHHRPGRAHPSPLRVDRHTEVVHPGEAARFWVATSAAILIIGLPVVVLAVGGGAMLLAATAVVVVALWLVTWLSLQVLAARLLGGCLRVNSRSLPELTEVIDEQRLRLGYAQAGELLCLRRGQRLDPLHELFRSPRSSSSRVTW